MDIIERIFSFLIDGVAFVFGFLVAGSFFGIVFVSLSGALVAGIVGGLLCAWALRRINRKLDRATDPLIERFARWTAGKTPPGKDRRN